MLGPSFDVTSAILAKDLTSRSFLTLVWKKFDLSKFWNEKVTPRKQVAAARLRDILSILTELLRVSLIGYRL